MAYAVAEIDTPNDVERALEAQVNWTRELLNRLARVQFEKRHEADFIALASTRLMATGQVPEKAEMERIKALCWKYRRQLPKTVAPRLPPHDPIVREMGLG